MDSTLSSVSPQSDIDQRVEELLGKLTLKEKVALLSGRDVWNTVAIERLGIPSITMTDGPHGVRLSEPEGGRMAGPATSFPTGVSMAASWNPEIIHRVGIALAEETLAMGCDILLAPCVNIVRTPLAGRNFESYSEDPYLAGRIGVAYVDGVQSRGVGASLKHFACNNQEFERMRGSSVVSERALREIYLAQFEAIVKESRPWTVMCSYNRVNGVYASQNNTLLNEILKGEWGFDGLVVSDWGANHTTVESVQGGLDLEMPGPARYYGGLLVDAVRNWQVEEAVVDEAARRVLRTVLRSGKMGGGGRGEGSLNTTAHQGLARELAEESITLLKNEGRLLPLDPDEIRSIAILGPHAAVGSIGGGGSSFLEPPYRVSPMEGLRSRLGEKVALRYELGCDNRVRRAARRNETSPQEKEDGIARAVELAGNSDLAIIFIGLPQGYETEGADRPDMELPGRQNDLVRAVASVNPNTVVVLNCGAPVTMPWLGEVPGVILAYYPGLEGGNAVARVLFGDVNPSGKLPVTFPVRLEDNPAYLNYPGKREVRYGEDIFAGYRYYDEKDIQPLFPFGFGLSYTTFEYSNLQAPETVKSGAAIRVSVQVRNTGDRAGKEVVQLYVHDKDSSLVRPPRELKGFEKIFLQPGEAQTVQFTLDPRALSFYDPDRRRWVAEPGEFEVQVGSSSRDIRAQATFTLTA